MRALEGYLSTRRDASRGLLLTDRSRPMNRNSVLEVLGGIGLRGGPENLHTHRFRHTYGDTLLGAGGQEGDLQVALGQSTSAMTKRYTRARQAGRALKAVRRLSPAERLA